MDPSLFLIVLGAINGVFAGLYRFAVTAPRRPLAAVRDAGLGGLVGTAVALCLALMLHQR